MHIDGGTADVCRPNSLIRAVLLALTVLCAPAAQAGEDAPYPVWWSTELKLESLDLIDGEIGRYFPRADRFHLVTTDMEKVFTDILIDEAHPEKGYSSKLKTIILSEHWIDDCRSLIEWTGKGLHVEYGNRYRMHVSKMLAIYSSRCFSLLALKQARPATASHVRDFLLGQDVMNYIPSMIGLGWFCDSLEKTLKENQDGVSWIDYFDINFKDYHYGHEIEVLDKNTVYVDTLYEPTPSNSHHVASSVKLTINGRGDFNGDGIDDILIKWDKISLLRNGDPDPIDSAVYVVTRYKRDDVLRVVDFYGRPPRDSDDRCDAKERIIESGRPE